MGKLAHYMPVTVLLWEGTRPQKEPLCSGAFRLAGRRASGQWARYTAVMGGSTECVRVSELVVREWTWGMGVRAALWNRVWLQWVRRVVLDRIFRIKEGFRWHLRLNVSLQIQWVAVNRVGDWGSSGRIPGINKIMRVRQNQTQTTVHGHRIDFVQSYVFFSYQRRNVRRICGRWWVWCKK